MPIKLAASTWNYLCTYGRDADLAESIGEISELGLAVELWLDWRADQRAVAPDRWLGIVKMLDSADVSLHSAMKTWNSETFKTEIDMASFLNASILVVHANSLGLTSDVNAEQDFEPCILASNYAAAKGIVLALENLPERGSIEMVRLAVETAPRLRVCIDMAHAHVTNYDIAETISEFGRKVVHVHVSDNLGERDDHLVPGEGNIGEQDWRNAFAVLAKIGYPGAIVMELRSKDAKRSAQKGAAFLRYVAGEAESVIVYKY